jgi:hypothetical protein
MAGVQNQAEREKNPLEILRLKPDDIKDLTPDKVKALIAAAYRGLSNMFHPDKGHGNAQAFKAIASAYERLMVSDDSLKSFLTAFLSVSDEQRLVGETIRRVQQQADSVGAVHRQTMEDLEQNYFGNLGLHHGRAITIECFPYCVAVTNKFATGLGGGDAEIVRQARSVRRRSKRPADEYREMDAALRPHQFKIIVDENQLVRELAAGHEIRRPDKVIIGTIGKSAYDRLAEHSRDASGVQPRQLLALSGAVAAFNPNDTEKLIVPPSVFMEMVQPHLSAELIPGLRSFHSKIPPEGALVAAMDKYLISCVHDREGNRYYVVEGYIGHEGRSPKNWFKFLG